MLACSVGLPSFVGLLGSFFGSFFGELLERTGASAGRGCGSGTAARWTFARGFGGWIPNRSPQGVDREAFGRQGRFAEQT